MQDENRLSSVQIRRAPTRLGRVAMGVCAIALLFLLSVIVQSLLGDEYLPSEGGLWHAVSQQVCRVAFWSTACVPASVSTSTSTSPSTSTSVLR